MKFLIDLFHRFWKRKLNKIEIQILFFKVVKNLIKSDGDFTTSDCVAGIEQFLEEKRLRISESQKRTLVSASTMLCEGDAAESLQNLFRKVYGSRNETEVFITIGEIRKLYKRAGIFT